MGREQKVSEEFKYIFDNIIEVEGGYVNSKADSGGETNYGITKRVARKFGYTGSMKDLDKSLARRIYFANYWKAPKLDLLWRVSSEVAEQLFDAGVNIGSGRANKFLQRVLNVLNRNQKRWKDLKVDGALGQLSRTALKRAVNNHLIGKENILKGLMILQGSHYITLAERRSKDEEFTLGWLNRIDLRKILK